MTNEEAIKHLQTYSTTNGSGQTTQAEHEEAKRMAIKALETIPKYKDAYNKGWDDGAKASYEHLKMCEDEQEPCEDEYIKVPKKALKYVTKGIVAYNAEWLKNHFDIEQAVICGVQESKTEKVIKMRDATPEEQKLVNDYIESISKPTGVNFGELEQEPKTGHWIKSKDWYGNFHYECSECGNDIIKQFDYSGDNYCLECGTRMVGDNTIDSSTDSSTDNEVSSTDFISRQAVLDYIHRILNQGTGKKKSFEFIQKYIEKLPPVTPQEQKYCDRNICLSNEYNGIGCDECEVTKSQEAGYWIPHSNGGIWIEYYTCSKCGKTHNTQSDYCEKCGAKMIEPQESEGEE